MRTPDELLDSALRVIDKAFALSPVVRHFGVMFPLYSGGYDSWCACFAASQHPRFVGNVWHIDTGIGSRKTRNYVNETSDWYDWELNVLKSRWTYERFVKTLGFPGPGAHQWVYNKLKERCVCMIDKLSKGHVILVTGCRSHESVRRMGHVEPIKVGEISKETGKVTKTNRVWIAPCHDWTDEEQREFILYHHVPRNPVKDSILAMSGECFCGAFARPNEREMIKAVCPDVDKEISRLEVIARENGIKEENCTWGRRDRKKGIEVVETGPMCNSCDRKAAAAGIIVKHCGGNFDGERQTEDKPVIALGNIGTERK